MTSLSINLIHLAGAGLGLWLIARLGRSGLSNALFWALALAGSAVMAGFLLDVSDPPRAFEDFITAYLAAGRAVLEGPQALTPLFEEGVNGFVNLPVLAYLFAPLAILPDALASLAFFGLGGAAVLAAWRLLAVHYRLDRTESALALFALASFGPLVYSFREGNVSHILLLALAGGVVLAAKGRDALAGAAFALAALIKPPLLLIGVFYAARGRFRIAAAGLAVCAGAALLSVAIFGVDLHALWIKEFRGYSGQPMPGFNAQSIASAIVRLELGPGSYRDWSPHALSTAGGAIVVALTLAIFAAGVWAGLRARGGGARDRDAEETELWLVAAFACVASTVSWSHYYVWLLPGLLHVYAHSRAGSPTAGLRPWLIAAYGLAAPVVFLGGLLERGVLGPLGSVLVSHELIGGLLTCGVLIWLRAGLPASTPWPLARSARPRPR